MKIGNLEIKNGVFLAPMAGVTDRAFRYMCKKYGVGGETTEMVSAKAICYNDKKTGRLAEIYPEDRHSGLQLFGSEPEIMAKAAKSVLLAYKPDFIDINMGCPAPKIVNNGEGSALMKKPSLCRDIVYAMKQVIGNDVPLTVKIRSGFDKTCINAVEVACLCKEAGADAVFVHARTREQMYQPPVDYTVIRDVKKAVGDTPVIGNGDITSGSEAVKVMEYTGCDGVMIGRAAQGNPYVFDEINCFLEGKAYTPVSLQTKRADIKQHIRLLIEDKGEYIGIREARKHVAWYIKGLSGAASMRNRVNLAESEGEMFLLIDEIFEVQ